MEKAVKEQKNQVFLIGGSAGSLKILLEVLPHLDKNLKFPIVIILHRKRSMDSPLSDLLKVRSGLEIIEAEEKQKLMPGIIYLAPPDYHLLIEKDLSFSLDFSEKLNYSRPSIDVTFISASQVYNENTTALLLSGANADGVEGLFFIKANNGTTLVQDPKTADVDYMPLQAISQVKIDFILKPPEIVDYINKLNVQ